MTSDMMLTASEARRIAFGRGIRYIKEQIFQACRSGTCETQTVIPLDKESKMYDLLDGYAVSHQNEIQLEAKLKALLVILTELGYCANIEFTTVTNGGEYYNATHYKAPKLIISWVGDHNASEAVFL